MKKEYWLLSGRQFLAVFWEAFREQVQGIVLIVGILLPLGFVLIFGDVDLTDLPKPKIGIATTEVPAAVTLEGALRESDGFRLVKDSARNLAAQLANFEIDPRENLSAYVVFSEENETEPEIFTRTSAANLGQTIRGIINQLNYQTLLTQTQTSSPLLEPVVTVVGVRDSTYLDFTMPGLIGITLISTCVYATAMSLESLFQSGVVMRIFTTPLPVWIFLSGNVLARVLFSQFQVGIVLLVGYWAYAYSPINGWLSLVQVFVLTVPASICLMSLGYCLGATLENPVLINNLAQLIIFPQIILCGTFIPITNFAPVLQDAIEILPLYQVNEVIREVTINGAALTSEAVGIHLGIMALWTVLCIGLILGNFRLR